MQEPSTRASPSQHHRRRDSTPTTFGDLGLMHLGGGERLTPPPQSMHARRHSATGAMTGMLNESPSAEQRFRRHVRMQHRSVPGEGVGSTHMPHVISVDDVIPHVICRFYAPSPLRLPVLRTCVEPQAGVSPSRRSPPDTVYLVRFSNLSTTPKLMTVTTVKYPAALVPGDSYTKVMQEGKRGAGTIPRAYELISKRLVNHTMSQVGLGAQSLFGVDNGEQVGLAFSVLSGFASTANRC